MKRRISLHQNVEEKKAVVWPPSIHEDRMGESAVPYCFMDTKTPVVCYKYNLPHRNTCLVAINNL